MKKRIALVLAVLVMCGTIGVSIYAEENDSENLLPHDWSGYTLQELQTMQREISAEIAQRLIQEYNAIQKVDSNTQETSDSAPLGKIKDLFPDETFACVIRDACGKFTIEQTVTQEDLNKIRKIYFYSEHEKIYTLSGIGYLKNLEKLNLSSCYEGIDLVDELYSLKKLHQLTIEFSNLTILSPLLGNLTELERIDLCYTKIQTLPDTIGNLNNLIFLIIRDNKLSSLPESIGNLYNLYYFNCIRNQISSLPDSIGNLVNLTSFDCSGNKISSLPDSIGNLVNLTEFDCSSNKISSLPDSIGNLVNLKELDISNTQITSLPDSIWNLNLNKLNMTGLPIK